MEQSSALLIIDVQYDFCPDGALAVPSGDSVIPVINGLIPAFPIVVATQDWHPSDHISFASAHPTAELYDTVDVDGVQQTLWPDHCVAASRGADLHGHLDQSGIDLILRKGTRRSIDSYSAFFENDGVTTTGLGYYLSGMGVTRVYLTGLATDFCVLYTARDALKLGFDVNLITDATEGVDVPRGSVNAALAEMANLGVESILSPEVH